MIPPGLTREQILAAMERIDHEGIAPGRGAWKFEVRHEGRLYPPKLLISLACEAAFGRALPSGAFSGGAETNRFLQRLGFTVVTKGGDAIPSTHARKPIKTPDAVNMPPATSFPQEQLETLKQQLLWSGKLYTWKTSSGIATCRQPPLVSTPGSSSQFRLKFRPKDASSGTG